ncbi:DUF922 domain-containing Zn-dependent protease [Pseudorhizobium xiangyangii]|uniref:DUF922 domain-containing Zn-dependent protease n=1 Tax=Pseudorhizobium xiangyangii TaxID=2883104 RepID=UPI0036F39CE4
MSLISSFRRIIGGLLLSCMLSTAATAAPSIAKTYGYFSIGGRTAEDLDRELGRRGPMTNATGHRHPGATEIKFGGEVTYVERGGQCSVGEAKVTLRTHLILPRWNNRRRAEKDLRFIWDTLSADIKRHEERHAEIARSYARTLERDLLNLKPTGTCENLEKKVGSTTKRVLEAHDRDQLRFDKVESKNFDNRMMRLLKYRLEQQGG